MKSKIDSKDEISIVLLVFGSIGSLGENGEKAEIDDILVQNITFIETSNGARIKTWQVGLTCVCLL